MAVTYYVYQTVIGPVTVVCSDESITSLRFGECPQENGEERETPLSRRCSEQLSEYLAGERQEFDLPLRPEGTVFQKSVWNVLLTIPYGETRSYADIAHRIGRPKACRAVGMANHRNPIAILIPCHRVVGKDGGLTGYAGGLKLKKQLLELEKMVVKK